MSDTRTRLTAGAIGLVLAIAAPVIAYHEGYIPKTYADPIGIPTVCYGQTGQAARPGAEYTLEECEGMLATEAVEVMTRLDKCLQAPLEPHEWAALVSLSYNVGTGAICSSTIARLIKAGEPAAVWCEQFPRWVYAGGKVLPGLVKRRVAERELCLGEST